MTSKNNVYVALLRGINVGGQNKVNMTNLKTCFETQGFANVRTYGNSGNIIFTTASTNLRELEILLEEILCQKFSAAIRVFIRSLAEMKGLVEEMPPDWQQANPERKYDVIFLHGVIDNPDILQKLQPKPEIEEIYYFQGVLFWSIRLLDFSKSNLSKLVGTALYQEMTIRSPSTVRKVYQLMSELNE